MHNIVSVCSTVSGDSYSLHEFPYNDGAYGGQKKSALLATCRAVKAPLTIGDAQADS